MLSTLNLIVYKQGKLHKTLSLAPVF